MKSNAIEADEKLNVNEEQLFNMWKKYTNIDNIERVCFKNFVTKYQVLFLKINSVDGRNKIIEYTKGKSNLISKIKDTNMDDGIIEIIKEFCEEFLLHIPLPKRESFLNDFVKYIKKISNSNNSNSFINSFLNFKRLCRRIFRKLKKS